MNNEREAEATSVTEAKPSELRIRNILEINQNLETGNMATTLSQIVGSSRDVDMDPDRTPSPDALAAALNAREISTTASAETSRKRSHDESDDSSGSSKKRKSLTPDPDEPTNSSSAEPSSSQPAETTSTVPQIAITQNVSAETTSTVPAITIKPDPDSTSSIIKTEGASDPPVKVKTETPSQTPPTAVVLLRPSCEFGIRCYRNTSDHRRDYAHPTDTDYRRPDFPPAPSSAPHCQFGSSCYRRNPDHFRSLQHPPSSKKRFSSTMLD